MLEQAYEAIARALADGELVGIFPEGRLTADGEIERVPRGITKILERTPVPVIPMALSGLWGSLFTRNRARLRHATKLFPKVRLVGRRAARPGARHAGGPARRGAYSAGRLEMKGSRRPSIELSPRIVRDAAQPVFVALLGSRAAPPPGGTRSAGRAP